MNKEFFSEYIKVFFKQNSVINLISANDEKYLWEKHIFDSLAIKKFFEKYVSGNTILDIGTGGGFPAVPIALCYPEKEVYALDGIRKKINAIENIKNELKINNLHPICGRAENLSNKYDIITSRAVASLDKICKYALPLMKGYFIAYKSVKVHEEIERSKEVLKKYNAKVVDIIEYNLPLNENYTRNLVIIKQTGIG